VSYICIYSKLISFLTTIMHNAGIHFGSISLTKAIDGNLKWWYIRAIPSPMFIIIVSITMLQCLIGLKILFNHAMETFSYYRFT